MNQTPASILVLSASILAYSSGVRTYDPVGVVLGIVGLAIGIWGAISLVAASIRDRELSLDGHSRLEPLDRILGRDVHRVPRATLSQVDRQDIELSPEIKAKLSMTAHLEGRDRTLIVEEALRRYLPRYERSDAA